MKDNRIEELTGYFARLGLTFDSDRNGWQRNGSDRLTGPYRGATLAVLAERAKDGHENTGRNFNTGNDSYLPLYRNYLRVTVQTRSPVRVPVCVIPRDHYALLDRHGFPVVNGQVRMEGKQAAGTDMMHSRYLAVNRLLNTGVLVFDTAFGVLCDDEAYAGQVLPPDLLGWIAADRRSYGLRLMFVENRLNLFVRTEHLPEPPELFVPESIFPSADYLIDLLGHAPVGIG